MRKKLITMCIATVLSISLLTGCHSATREYGGSMELELPPNQKLEEITWKEDSLIK